MIIVAVPVSKMRRYNAVSGATQRVIVYFQEAVPVDASLLNTRVSNSHGAQK